jgi:hypothetical protein
MNRPAGSVAAWWASPLDIDAQHPVIPFPREPGDVRVGAGEFEPLGARIARVMRTDISELKSSVRQREAELTA